MSFGCKIIMLDRHLAHTKNIAQQIHWFHSQSHNYACIYSAKKDLSKFDSIMMWINAVTIIIQLLYNLIEMI